MTHRRIFIGDVHGHYDGLMLLLEAISPRSEDRIYFLGDLIDRGPKSAQVVEFVRQSPYHCLLGNHEQLLVEYFAQGQLSGRLLQAWKRFNPKTYNSYEAIGLSKLGEHLEWIQTLPSHLDLGDIWLVHAGVDPKLPIHEQTTAQFCWIRHQFHSITKPYFPDKLIVTGHTITCNFPGVAPGQLVQGQGWLDIETGAHLPLSGWLTGLDITNRVVYQVNVFKHCVRRLPFKQAVTQISPRAFKPVVNKSQILVAHQKPEIAKMFRQMLPASNYEIIEARDGEEALKFIQKKVPSLIVLGFVLPKLSSWEVLPILQYDPKFYKIPVLIVASSREEISLKIPDSVLSFEFLDRNFDKNKLLLAMRVAFQTAKKAVYKSAPQFKKSSSFNQVESHRYRESKIERIPVTEVQGYSKTQVLEKLPDVKSDRERNEDMEKTEALKEAIAQGQLGLNRVIQALQDPSNRVRKSAYMLLREKAEPNVKQALKEYNPYQFFECLLTLRGHKRMVYDIAIAPDNLILASASHDRTIKIWDLATGSLKTTLTGHEGWVLSVAIAPDGKTVVSGSYDNTIAIWDLGTDTPDPHSSLQSTLKGHSGWVLGLAIDPDGKTLVSCSDDKTIRIWDIDRDKRDKSPSLQTTLTGHTQAVLGVAIAPDGKTLVSGSRDGTLKLWDLRTGTLLNTFQGHTGSVTCVAISPNRLTIASSSEDRTIKLWDLRTGTLINTLQGHTKSVSSVAFSPDGQILVSGSDDGTIKIWDMNPHEAASSPRTLTEKKHGVWSVTMSPDGLSLVSCTHWTIDIWGMREDI